MSAVPPSTVRDLLSIPNTFRIDRSCLKKNIAGNELRGNSTA